MRCCGLFIGTCTTFIVIFFKSICHWKRFALLCLNDEKTCHFLRPQFVFPHFQKITLKLSYCIILYCCDFGGDFYLGPIRYLSGVIIFLKQYRYGMKLSTMSCVSFDHTESLGLPGGVLGKCWRRWFHHLLSVLWDPAFIIQWLSEAGAGLWDGVIYSWFDLYS